MDYENSSDEFNIELHRIKVQVTVGIFHHLPQYKLSGPIVQVWCKLGTLYQACMLIWYNIQNLLMSSCSNDFTHS